jgi:hypothetical protein
MVAWPRRTGPRASLESLRSPLRPGAHLPLLQANSGMGHASGATSRAGRQVELADRGGLHATAPGASVCGGSTAALGEAIHSGQADPESGSPDSFGAFGGVRDARQATETLRTLTRTA